MTAQKRYMKAQGQRSLGFTLVELLVVITIIAILAGLATVGVMSAMNTARNTVIKTEIGNIDLAMKEFKNRYGAYPPCDLRVGNDTTSNPALRAFLAKAFPRYAKTSTNQLDDDLQAAGVDTANFKPDRALVFWLSGFSPDVTNPFTGTGTRTPLYEFDKTRVLIASGTGIGTPALETTLNGNKVYVSPRGMNVPYLYYDSRVYGTGGDGTTAPANPLAYTYAHVSSGTAVPYAHRVVPNTSTSVVATDNWANRDSFQIISAGQDGNFGAGGSTVVVRVFPNGVNYTTEDKDNITNFNDRATLEDSLP